MTQLSLLHEELAFLPFQQEGRNAIVCVCRIDSNFIFSEMEAETSAEKSDLDVKVS